MSVRSYKDLEVKGAFEKIIQEACDLIKKEGGRDTSSMELQEQTQHRLRFADRLRQRALNMPFSRSVFIAYSGDPSYFYRAKDFFEERGYRVAAGAVDRQTRHISKNVVHAIRYSRFFLAIWSLGYVITRRSDSGRILKTTEGWIPSMWMPFELATAVTLGKERQILWVEDKKWHPHEDTFTRMLGDHQRPELTMQNAADELKVVWERFETIIRDSRPFKASDRQD